MTLKRDAHVVIQPWGIVGVVVVVRSVADDLGRQSSGWAEVEYQEGGRITRQDFPVTRLELVSPQPKP